MGSLVVALLPFALGIIASPLTIVAVIVVLVSPRGRTNSVGFLVGWVGGIAAVVGASWAVFDALDVQPKEGKDTPGWVGVVHLLIGAVLLVAAWWIYRHQMARVRQMAAAITPPEVAAAAQAPLPGWLQKVDGFTVGRTAALAVALMVINPVDLTCGIGAGLQIALSGVSSAAATLALIVFTLVSGVAVIVPVAILLTRGARARPLLVRMRNWIAGNTGLVNALLLVVVGVLQVVKGIQQI